MLKKSVWRRSASDAVSFHQDQALTTTILLLKTYGPTGFLLWEEGDSRNFKVFLGQPHSCTCPVFVREQEPCKHICWVLLRKFRLHKEHEYCFQSGLSEWQISELLHGSLQIGHTSSGAAGSENPTLQEPGGVIRKTIQAQDVCPICQEELLEKRQPVAYCRFSCGNNVHISCMKVWAEHQQRSDTDVMVKCPLCREDFSSVRSLREQVKNAGKLHTAAERERPDKHLGVSCHGCGVCPISGKCFKCTVCRYVFLCETCSEKGHHPQHQFAFCSKRKEEWRCVSKGSSGALSVNDKVVSDPIPQDPLPDSVLVHVCVVQVRAGSQLLEEGLQCRLCLQSFTLGQSVRSLPCRHKFHAGCVDGILRTTNSCPLDGYVIYNPETWGACERKTTPKLASSKTRHPAKQTDNSFTDLFVPGVALQEKKTPSLTQQTHQLEALPNSSQHSNYTDTGLSLGLAVAHSSKANSSQHCVKKVLSKCAPSSAPAHISEQHQTSLCVGVLNPNPQAKVSPCRRVRPQPKIRSTDKKAVPSELTMTGVLLVTQRKSDVTP